MTPVGMSPSAAHAGDQALRFDRPLVWLAAGAVASMFAVGAQWDIAIAAWVAPIFLLRFSRASRPWAATSLIALVAVADVLYWWVEVGNAGKLVPENLLLIPLGLIFALPYAMDRLLAPRLGLVGRLMVFPAAWACAEFLLGSLSPLGGTYGLRAVTQTDNLPVLQLTALLGPYSIGFLIGLSATTVNGLWETPSHSRVRTAGAAVAALFALVFIGGGLRLAFTTPPKAYVRMAAITPSMYAQTAARAMIEGRPADPRAYVDPSQMHSGTLLFANKAEVAHVSPAVARQAYSIVYDDLFSSTRSAAHSGAKIVVWSETAAPLLSEADKPALLAKIGEVAREEGIFIDAAIGQPFTRNETHLLGPDGKELWAYDKNHPVPMMEPVKPRRMPAPTAFTPFGRLTNIICFDADFPAQSRVNADVMLVPGFDWPQIGRAHTLKMASVRAIENGYAMIRSAYWSQSAAFDRLGRVLATQDTTGPDAHIMYADVPTTGVRTVYNRTGDILIWFSLAGLVAAVTAAYRQIPAR